MCSGRGGGIAIVQIDRSFTCCSGMPTETPGVANNGKKVTTWWKQVVKDAIRAKKVAPKAWLQNKADSFLRSRYSRRRDSLLLSRWKSVGEFCGHKLGFQLVPSLQSILANHLAHAEKDLILLDPSNKNGILLRNETDVVGRWWEYFKDLLKPVAITPPCTHKVHLGMKTP